MSHLTHMQIALGAGAVAGVTFLLLILVAAADGCFSGDWEARENVWAWLGRILGLVLLISGAVALIELVRALWVLAGRMP